MGRSAMSIDPICGRRVPEEAADSVEYKRRTYFFCSPRCRGRFERHAERIHVGELAKMGALFQEKKGYWGLA